MNELQIFNYNGVHGIRSIIIDGNPEFIAQDVCQCLEIDTTQTRRLDEDEKGLRLIQTRGGEQEMVTVTEAGLYSLILGSRKPEAKAFKRWVTHEVLPSIRKHGLYATDQLLNDPDLAIRAFTALKEERERNKQLAATVQLQQPKVDFYDAVAGSKDAISIRDAAKVLAIPNVGQNKLFSLLREHKVLMNDNKPYQEYIDRGYFRLIEQKYTVHGEARVDFKTLVYQKGLDYIRRLLTNTAVSA